jgi:hypothetical protein
MLLAPLNDWGLTVFAHEKEDILKVLTCRIELARNNQNRMKLFLAENTSSNLRGSCGVGQRSAVEARACGHGQPGMSKPLRTYLKESDRNETILSGFAP